MKRFFKRLNIYILIGAIILNISSYKIYGAENEVSVSKTTVNVVEGDGRTYTVTYTIDCEVNETVNSDVTIVIDRSGSMLYRAKDENGNYKYDDSGNYIYVVDEVEDAIITFINEIMSIEGNQIAIVAYGSSATQLNSGNYYTNTAAAIATVETLLDYSYSSWYSFGTGISTNIRWRYDYGINQATNIQSGLEEAQDIVENTYSTNENKDVVLFTDGVANTGSYYWESEETMTVYEERVIGYDTVWLGSYLSYDERNQYSDYRIYYSYYYRQYYCRVPEYETVAVEVPVTIITDGGDPVQAAILQAEELKQIAGVTLFSLGYTNGLNETTASASASTLMDIASNTSDSYIAPTGDELLSLFAKISSKINYMGTEAVVNDILAEGFQIVAGSLDVSDNAVFSNADNSELTWNIGNLGSGTHTLTLQIEVLDSYYPSGRNHVPTSDSCSLTYVDLDGNDVEVVFEINYVDISGLEGGPRVAHSYEHLYGTNGEYLVGDTAWIAHNLSFVNSDGFDYIQIEVGNFDKQLSGSAVGLEDAFELLGDDKWHITGQSIQAALSESELVADPTALIWQADALLELNCLAEGEFGFNHLLDYTLTNPYGIEHTFELDSNIADVIKVKEGIITINLIDTNGIGVEDARLIINGTDQGIASTANGILTVGNIPTGEYTIEVDIPSGYELPDGHGYTINEDNHIVLNHSMNYANNTYSQTITFNKLIIRNIAVKTIDGQDNILITEVGKHIEGRVEFETLSDMQYLALNLVDDYDSSHIIFDLLSVKDSNGTEVGGFYKLGSEIIYSGTNLPTGEYVAYVDITLPPSIKDGDLFEIDVDEVESQGVLDINLVRNTVTSEELLVTYDTTVPVITLSPSQNGRLSTDVDVLITSAGSDIIEYKCLAGERTVEDFAFITNEIGLNTIDATNLKEVTAQFQVYLEGEAVEDTVDGVYIGNGTFTVYAKNAIGKETVKTITISNLFDESEVDYDLF